LPEVRATAVVVMARGGIDLEERRLGDANQRGELLSSASEGARLSTRP